MKVTVGLTTWSEHPSLINNARKKTTLKEYGQHFPVVEVDTFFYALPQLMTVQKWLTDVAPGFQFIVKAHQVMTGHQEAVGGPQAVFTQFKQVVAPLVSTGQLKTVLFQFPPYFDARTEHIEYLRTVRELMGNLPVAVELRNRSWYQSGVGDALVNYCRDLKLTLVAADEPHQTQGGIPLFLTTTTPHLTLVRLHGRNQAGWQAGGQGLAGQADPVPILGERTNRPGPSNPRTTAATKKKLASSLTTTRGAMRPTTPSPSAGKWIYTLRA